MIENEVKCLVDKIYQSPTTPVVKLTYLVDIESAGYGVNGVFDIDDQDVIDLIGLLEKIHFKKLYPNGL